MNKFEDKHTKFIRLAEKRVNNAIKSIELIGNLSNKNNYEYSHKDVQKIIKTLKKSVDNVEYKFNSSSSMTFRLK